MPVCFLAHSFWRAQALQPEQPLQPAQPPLFLSVRTAKNTIPKMIATVMIVAAI